MKKLLSIILAMIMVMATFTVVSFADDEEVEFTPDKTWYDASKTEYEISTPAQLLGFAKLLNEGTTFEGKTIKLTANIDLNPGWDEKEYVANTMDTDDMTIAIPPINVWPITNCTTSPDITAGEGVDQTVRFGGTFDGQNHYISGIYAVMTGHDPALFGWGLYKDGVTTTIKNLALVNSYIDGGGNARGAVVIAKGGTNTVLENLYVDVDARKPRSGNVDTGADGFAGIIGWLGNASLANATATIKKCVYAGTIYCTATYKEATDSKGNTYQAGGYGAYGIISCVDDATQSATIEDCLVIGGARTTGRVAGVSVKNKGTMNITSVAVAWDVMEVPQLNGTEVVKNGPAKNIAFLYDMRYNSVFTGSGLVYIKAATDAAAYDHIDFKVTNEVEDDPATTENEAKKYTGNRLTATEATADNIKAINTWASTQSISGYADWASTVDGQAMPISAELAATVTAYLTADNTPAGGNDNQTGGNDNQTGSNDNQTSDNKKDDETTDTETEAATTKAAETTEAAEEKGCGGIIGAGALVIVAVTGTALAVGAKKRED